MKTLIILALLFGAQAHAQSADDVAERMFHAKANAQTADRELENQRARSNRLSEMEANGFDNVTTADGMTIYDLDNN